MRRAPAILDSLRTIWTLNDDGTGRKETHLRVKVQHQAAVQTLGQLRWGYNSGSEAFELLYLRVRKPDGKVLSVGDEAIQEVTAGAAFGGVAYTDFREKHVMVPALTPGDTLEFACAINTKTAHTPGHYWGQHQFTTQGVCLSETLEIRHPRDRKVIFKVKPEFKGDESIDGSMKVHRWQHSYVEPLPPEGQEQLLPFLKQQFRAMGKRNESPDVQFTTFKNWSQVGDWYAALEGPQRVSNPDMRQKAESLLAGRKGDLDRIGALYGFVTQEFRYLSLSFGQGRYQPHSASEVFSNRYGDCKDKGNLLAAFLAVAGYAPEVALCNANRKLDPDVPSPAQFDHLIVRIPMPEQPVWLDATIPTSPFGAVMPQLRGEWALVVRPGGASSLERIPEDLPYPTFHSCEAEGEIDEQGVLTLKARLAIRTDEEVQLRAMLRYSSPDDRKWKLANLLGLPGEVQDFETKALDDLGIPLEIRVTTRQRDVLGTGPQEGLTVQIPLPKLELKDVDEEGLTNEPFQLAPARSQSFRLALTLPKGLKATMPIPIDRVRPYGRFSSTYTQEGQQIKILRKVTLNASKLPVSALRDWQAFYRSVEADQEQTIKAQWSDPAARPMAAAKPMAEDVKSLSNQAHAEMEKGNLRLAISMYLKVVELAPSHQDAWNNLGRCYAKSLQFPEAEKSYRKAIELNPFEAYAYNNLGLLLYQSGRTNEAEASLRKQIEVSPLDRFAHANLGQLLLQTGRSDEAVASLRTALQITPDNTSASTRLGEALLRSGRRDEAKALFEDMAAKGTNPGLWNNIAYLQAEAGGDLAFALKLAEGSLNAQATQLGSTPLGQDPWRQFALTLATAATLDTLGWIHHRLGHSEVSLQYIRASHALNPSPVVREHLAVLLEAKGDIRQAMAEVGRALLPPLPRPSLSEEFPIPRLQAMLERLAGGKQKAQAIIEKAKTHGETDRLVKLPVILKKDAQASAFIETDSEGRITGLHFIQGEEEFKGLIPQIKAMTFPLGLPKDCPLTRVVRNSRLIADRNTGEVHIIFTERIAIPVPLAVVKGLTREMVVGRGE